MRRHPIPPDAPVCGTHQSDGDPTCDVSTSPVVDITALCLKEASYPFQGSQRLHSQYPINGGYEGQMVLAFLEA